MAKGTKTGGRKAGTPNKATASLRELAREHTAGALATLVGVMANESEPAAARVSAANSLLDRGYGKPSQVLAGDEEGGAVQLAHQITLRGVRAS